MIGPLSYGPPTRHVLISNGADCNQSKFYVTEYSSRHGKEDFLPRVGAHHGTGYKSNYRPSLYYSQRLDELDNPKLGKTLQENYKSMNSLDFRLPIGSNGKDKFPRSLHMVKSGFVKDVPKTLVCSQKIRSACYNPGNVDSIQAKPPRSLLYNLRNKDPVEKENGYHGPSFMSTENKSRFLGEGNQRMDTSQRTIGRKEESGFTHAYSNEPITCRPDGCFAKNNAWKQHTKPCYTPDESSKGKQDLKLLSKRAERDTGYTRGIKVRLEYAGHNLKETYTKLTDIHPLLQQKLKKNDMAQYFDCMYANPFPSMTTATFKGLQNDPSTSGSKTLHSIIDNDKQETGFTENNCKFIKTAETPESLKRFETHYHLRFHDKNKKASDGDKKLHSAMQQCSNGFMKGTKVHSFGEKLESRKQIQGLHPYAAKSMVARDPYTVL